MVATWSGKANEQERLDTKPVLPILCGRVACGILDWMFIPAECHTRQALSESMSAEDMEAKECEEEQPWLS